MNDSDVHAGWAAWVATNLGDDPVASRAAVEAAVESIEKGAGLPAASAAAVNAWLASGRGVQIHQLSFWRVVTADPRKVAVAAALRGRGVLVPGELIDVKVTLHDRGQGERYTATNEYEWNGARYTVRREGIRPRTSSCFSIHISRQLRWWCRTPSRTELALRV